MTGSARRKFRTARRLLAPGAYDALRVVERSDAAAVSAPSHQYTPEEFAVARARYRAREAQTVAQIHALIVRVDALIQKSQKLPAVPEISTHLNSSQVH